MQATPLQYASVLNELQRQTGDARLHPNELRLAFRAVRGLFKSLARCRDPPDDALRPLAGQLYLPTSHARLARSTDMVRVCVDRRLKKSKIKFSHTRWARS